MAYFCQECGYKSIKWLGRCPECGAWGTFVEEPEDEKVVYSKSQISKKVNIFKLSEITYQPHERIKTGISEFDIVIGGGIVPSSLILIGGDPGIGKSTLLTQIAGNLSNKGLKVVFLSAEESPEQVRLRTERLKIKSDIYFVTENDLSAVIESLKEFKPDVLIIDSIQTVYLSELQSSPGSVSQVRECANLLLRFAKEERIVVIMVGHITKGGIIAGPKVLEHLVDVVLYLEGEKETGFRILRAVKNRFGPVNEIGVFVMTSEGLFPHSHYEDIFLSGEENAAVFCIMEGTRPLLVEVQALVTKSFLSIPKRIVAGLDPVRLSLIVAILEKKLGLNFSNQDIYVKVAGGIRISDPASDLAVAVSLISSLIEKPIPSKTVFIGEIGLSGELRPIREMTLRLREAEKKGFKRAFTPKGVDLFQKGSSLEVVSCKNLIEVVERLFK